MALDGRLLSRAMDRLEADRRRREEGEQALRRQLYLRDPALEELDRQLQGTAARTLELALRAGEDPVKAMEGLREENLRLQERRRERIAALPAPEADKPETVFTSDEGMVLYSVGGHRAKKFAEGTLSASDRGLHFGELFFPFADMAALAVRLRGTVTFSMKDGAYYELKKADKSDYSGRKYKCLFDRFAEDAAPAARQ